MRYEYRVVPAPERGEKVKGVKGAEGRFAAAVERIMNDMAARGWEYLRSDTLPSEERAGLTGTQTVWRNLLVFRRAAQTDAEPFQPRMLAPPAALPAAVEVPKAAERITRDVTGPAAEDWGLDDEAGLLLHPPHALRADDGVEDGTDGSDRVIGLPGALRARAERLRTPRS